MLETFRLTVDQVLVMAIFLGVGYLLRRLKVVPENTSRVLSSILVKVILPALNFQTFAKKMRVENLKANMSTVLIGIAVLAGTFVFAYIMSRLFSRGQDKMTYATYHYSFTVADYGYLGYPLVLAVFGEDVLFTMMLYTIPLNILVYTWGFYVLNPKREFKPRAFINPVTIAMLLGIVIGLLGIDLPEIVNLTLDKATGCLMPLALIMSGIVLTKVPLLKTFLSIKQYLAAFVRLLLIPALIGGILWLCHAPHEAIVVAVMTAAMPMGKNPIVFAEAAGGDGSTGAKLCVVSIILSIFTIPAVVAALSWVK